jgi:hypothetical protein
LDFVSRQKIFEWDYLYCQLLSARIIDLSSDISRWVFEKFERYVDCPETDVVNVPLGSVTRPRGYTLRSVVVRSDVPKYIVCDDINELRLGSESGFLWCREFVTLVFEKKFSGQIHVVIETCVHEICPRWLKDVVEKSGVLGILNSHVSKSSPTVSEHHTPRAKKESRPVSTPPNRPSRPAQRVAKPKLREKQKVVAVDQVKKRTVRKQRERNENKENCIQSSLVAQLASSSEASLEKLIEASSIPSKRRICIEWLEFGKCVHENCHFAHSLDERIYHSFLSCSLQ